MQAAHENVLTRDDTFFGVCEALGQDFGFNPFFLRLALGLTLIWNPLASFAAYAALAIAVAVSRLLAPVPRPASAAATAEAPTGETAPAEGNDNADAEMLSAAA